VDRVSSSDVIVRRGVLCCALGNQMDTTETHV
jgi:hypothetical protein